MIPKRLYDKTTDKWYDTDPHQIEAYEHLASFDRAALFLEMSLSKTVVTLTLLDYLIYWDAAVTKALVIAPDKVARITWPDEIEKWGHLEGVRYSVISGDAKKRLKALNSDAEVHIIGVDNLTWLIGQFLRKKGGRWVGSLPYECIVIDELSLFKNRDSERFKALRRAIKTVEYRYGLTGTPTPKGLINLWSEIMLLDDGERLGATFGEFVDKYFTTRGNGMIIYEYIPKPGADKVIAHKIRDIALSMKTRDYLDLPKLNIVDNTLVFNDVDKNTYNRLEAQYVIDFIEGNGVSVKTPADLSNKLLQISSGAIYEDQHYDEDGKKLPRVWHELNTVKIDALRALLDEHPDENFIVVYQYRHEIDRIKAAFPFAREFRKGRKTVEDFRDWNEGKIRLLLIHPAGAGHGLNLQYGGRRMVWFSLTWDLELYQQAVARLLRRGQLNEMYLHRLLIEGTRDFRVRRKLDTREGDQTFLMDEIKYLRTKYGR